MLARLSPANLMLMKGHLSVKSLAAIAVFTACLPGPSLAAAKWARCTPYPKDRAITVVYDVELKTDSEKISLISDSRVDKNKLDSQMHAESERLQIIAPAKWFPTKVVIGPFESYSYTYTSSNGQSITQRSKNTISISRENLSYGWGNGALDVGSCRIIPSPVKTLF